MKTSKGLGHVRLIGDINEAKKWVPWAQSQLFSMDSGVRAGFSKSLVPAENIRVDIQRNENIRNIIIRAEDPIVWKPLFFHLQFLTGTHYTLDYHAANEAVADETTTWTYPGTPGSAKYTRAKRHELWLTYDPSHVPENSPNFPFQVDLPVDENIANNDIDPTPVRSTQVTFPTFSLTNTGPMMSGIWPGQGYDMSAEWLVTDAPDVDVGYGDVLPIELGELDLSFHRLDYPQNDDARGVTGTITREELTVEEMYARLALPSTITVTHIETGKQKEYALSTDPSEIGAWFCWWHPID